MNEVLLLDKSEFEIDSVDDEIRADSLCRDLLLKFYHHLLEKEMAPEDATSLASGADYFTRDFVISRKQMSIFDEQPGIVRQFAGNWYITNTLEPDIDELSFYLKGICAFFRFMYESGLVSGRHLETVEKECADGEYYKKRIESFWDIHGDGYFAWEKECTLKG